MHQDTLHADVGAHAVLPSRAPRVCLIDDDFDTAEVVQAMLRDAGYEVECHCDGERALQHLRRQPADLILLDLCMPGMNGWQFRIAQRADDALAVIPVVIMTGDGSPQASAIDAASLLRKPFAGGALVATVQRVLLESKRRRFAASLEETGRLALLRAGAAGVGHEVNSPLAAAMTNLALMEESLLSFRTDLVALETARGETTDHATRGELRAKLELLQEQLHESRSELERVRLVVRNLQSLCSDADADRARLDLNQLVETSIAMARSQLLHRARITRAYGDVPPVWGNEARLMQVFLQLLVHAAQTLPAERNREHSIRITTRTEGGYAITEILGSYTGASEGMKSHAFESHAPAQNQVGFTGLGTPTCIDIIQAHLGQLDVSSEPGGGGRILVRLPCEPLDSVRLPPREPPARAVIGEADRPVDVSSPEETRAAAPEPPRPKLWIVDDEPAMTRVIAHLLSDEYAVVVSETPTDVLLRLQAGETFDVMLCDVMMPEMTGVDLAIRIEAQCAGLAQRIVFMSGGALSARLHAYVTAPGRRFTEKPFAVEALREITRSVAQLGHARGLRSSISH